MATGTDAARHGTGDADLTIMVAAHNAFRRDLTRLAKAAAFADLPDPARRAAVRAGWETFKHQLHMHHTAEDAIIWPALRTRLTRSPNAESVLDAMEAEHSLVDPLLAAVDEAFAHPDSGRIGDTADALTTTLLRHLTHEEHDALPLIGVALTASEWRGAGLKMARRNGLSASGEMFAWLNDGADPAAAAAVMKTLPPPVRLVYRGIWKPRYARTERWLREDAIPRDERLADNRRLIGHPRHGRGLSLRRRLHHAELSLQADERIGARVEDDLRQPASGEGERDTRSARDVPCVRIHGHVRDVGERPVQFGGQPWRDHVLREDALDGVERSRAGIGPGQVRVPVGEVSLECGRVGRQRTKIRVRYQVGFRHAEHEKRQRSRVIRSGTVGGFPRVYCVAVAGQVPQRRPARLVFDLAKHPLVRADRRLPKGGGGRLVGQQLDGEGGRGGRAASREQCQRDGRRRARGDRRQQREAPPPGEREGAADPASSLRNQCLEAGLGLG
jgi:hypothetical protein